MTSDRPLTTCPTKLPAAVDPDAYPAHRRSSGASRSLHRSRLGLLCLVLVAVGAGCASNRTFPTGAPLDVPVLARDLEAQPEDEEALFDLAYWPLLHLDLSLFTESEEASDYPDGHTFFTIRSWLPAFMIVDGRVSFFDEAHAAYEENEFSAVLWGLWARNQLTIRTEHGDRVAREHRLLWIFGWDEPVEYRLR